MFVVLGLFSFRGGFALILSIFAYFLSYSLVRVTLSLIYVTNLLSIYRLGLLSRFVGWVISCARRPWYYCCTSRRFYCDLNWVSLSLSLDSDIN